MKAMKAKEKKKKEMLTIMAEKMIKILFSF